MCGIAGVVTRNGSPLDAPARRLEVMRGLISHRGPDGEGDWVASDQNAALAHVRLAIIDLTEDGAQPMVGDNDTVITFNGEIYNFIELRNQLADFWDFRSHSDTETILAAYAKWGEDCVDHLRGMFAFAIWDAREGKLFCARDRFGIKPFYYAQVDSGFYFASEIKALAPFLPEIETDQKALSEYISFQFPISDRTLFSGVRQLLPGQAMTVKSGQVNVRTYWDVRYTHDRSWTADSARERLRELMSDSINVHLRSDVPIGAYLSGGVDSSLIAILAREHADENNLAFHGKFTCHPGYDESSYARTVAQQVGSQLHEIDITADDFVNNIANVIYHLDHPLAGPGSFPQYMVSQLAGSHVKVVLGGQGGDEIFGGYARYMVGYLEQLIRGGIEGRLDDGSFGVSFESVIPNLDLLGTYKPLIKEFFSKGLFEPLDRRFFRLINRSNDMADEIDWNAIDLDHVSSTFSGVFNDRSSIDENMYLDAMTRFDFKRLLPALCHIEDRMSMAHGLEARVPILDHTVVEFVASLPPEIKYEGGRLKELLRTTYKDRLPSSLFERRDKMGFPVPLKEWYADELGDFVRDIFTSEAARSRPFMNSEKVLENFRGDSKFSRKTWGLLSLELWQQQFHDKAHEYRKLMDMPSTPTQATA